jgi:hypothetical protein
LQKMLSKEHLPMVSGQSVSRNRQYRSAGTTLLRTGEVVELGTRNIVPNGPAPLPALRNLIVDALRPIFPKLK